MRHLLVLAQAAVLAAALGGCNLVYSEQPMFTAANAAAAPQAEAGLWLMESENCTVDLAAPVPDWPACAEHQTVADHGPRAFRLFPGGDLRLSAGDPLILQTRERDDHGRWVYFYAGGLATAYGLDGRATAFRFWPVQCGPPPPKPAQGEAHSRYVTRAPLPGLKIHGDDCRARDPAAIRRAAQASEAWAETTSAIRWVRAR